MARSSVSADLPQLAASTRVVALVSGYHSAVTHRMAESAQRTLVELGLRPEGWIEIAAPGAFELPLLAQRAARRPEVDAVLCFGLVLKGETPHDVYIAQAVADGLLRVGLENDKPVLLGVLTTLDLEQAEHRAASRTSGGLDKGHEVAVACAAALHALAVIDDVIDGPALQ